MTIDTDLKTEFRDCGLWRSYWLYANGSSFDALCDDATISEIDQDGGEIASYGLGDASNELRDEVESLVKAKVRSVKKLI